ncbi:hypothetical protein L218DRAFT_4101 [Marasmius fiardii PR-910]|nr:hypothetical protein L218DRAFT_4101 [Marasmius fiardii PR-910]
MSSMDLTFERSLYIGGQFTGILYGVQLVLFAISCRLMTRPPYGAKSDSRFYICYGACLLVLWTTALSCNAVFGQLAWIDHRDVEGGPATYIGEHISDPYNTLGTTAGVALNFLADALLIYRCYVIWSSWIVVLFPAFLYVGTFAMSLLLIYESAQPGANFFKGHAVDFGVPYIALTISNNVIVTSLICGRLITVKSRMRTAIGPDHAKMYTSVIAIMVESAAPFTILGVIYAITYARHSPTSIAFVQLWGDFCALSPQFIILRVAMGKAWSKGTSGQLTTPHLTFSAGDTDTVKTDTVFSETVSGIPKESELV